MQAEGVPQGSGHLGGRWQLPGVVPTSLASAGAGGHSPEPLALLRNHLPLKGIPRALVAKETTAARAVSSQATRRPARTHTLDKSSQKLVPTLRPKDK